MKYSPKGDITKALTVSLAMLAITVVSVVMTANAIAAPWISQLVMLVYSVAAIQIYIKYILSEYTYVFDHKQFFIDKIVGKRIIPLGALSLSESLSHVMKMSEFKSKKNDLPKIEMQLNYCKTMWLSDPYVYIFKFNEKVAMLTFEPTEKFASALNFAIDYAKNGDNITK